MFDYSRNVTVYRPCGKYTYQSIVQSVNTSDLSSNMTNIIIMRPGIHGSWENILASQILETPYHS